MRVSDARQRAPAACLPFAGLTGEGVRIAVIDSGVHPDHPHIAADRLSPGIAIAPDGTIDTGVDAARDRLGHGTAVVAAIQEKAPGATCLPVRVFREALKTSAAALVAAIRWSVEQEVDIVNLSLGSVNAAHREIFSRVAHEAAQAGILILSAHEANGEACYPGALPEVLGIGLDWDCPRERYRLDGDRFLASGYPRPISGVPLRRNLYGISFAVAQMSGFAALAAQQAGDMPRPAERAVAIRDGLAAEARPLARP